MKISVNGPSKAKRRVFQHSVIDQMTKSLNRLSKRITCVNVTLTDENGPRGGIDKQCRVSIVLPPFGELTASAIAANPWAAFARAVERLRRVVLTKLKRPRSLQIRKCKSCSQSTESSAEGYSET